MGKSMLKQAEELLKFVEQLQREFGEQKEETENKENKDKEGGE